MIEIVFNTLEEFKKELDSLIITTLQFDIESGSTIDGDLLIQAFLYQSEENYNILTFKTSDLDKKEKLRILVSEYIKKASKIKV